MFSTQTMSHIDGSIIPQALLTWCFPRNSLRFLFLSSYMTRHPWEWKSLSSKTAKVLVVIVWKYSQWFYCVSRLSPENLGCLFPFGCAVACRSLAPQPGIEPLPLQWKYGVLTTGLPGKSPKNLSLKTTTNKGTYCLWIPCRKLMDGWDISTSLRRTE